MAVRIGELLLKEKRITPEQLQQALNAQRQNGGKLGNSLVSLDLSGLESAGTLLIRGNTSLDDEPLAPLELLPNARIKIVSNRSGPARLSPCPWRNDGVCDEEQADCAAGSDVADCSWL